MMPDGVIWTAAETADFLRVSRATVQRWCQQGKLPAFKIGREWRINGEKLQKVVHLMESGETKSSALGTVTGEREAVRPSEISL